MKRKTTTIILITTFIVILACSIIFGTIVTCVNRQKPLITVEMPLKIAIKQGLAGNYDYFVKSELGTHKYDNKKPPYSHSNSTMYIADESLGDNYKVELWYCKYLMRSQKEGMCEIDNVSIEDFESYLYGDPWIRLYEIEDRINVYYINTFAHNDDRNDLYFNYYMVITASQAIIDDMSSL